MTARCGQRSTSGEGVATSMGWFAGVCACVGWCEQELAYLWVLGAKQAHIVKIRMGVYTRTSAYQQKQSRVRVWANKQIHLLQLQEQV